MSTLFFTKKYLFLIVLSISVTGLVFYLRIIHYVTTAVKEDEQIKKNYSRYANRTKNYEPARYTHAHYISRKMLDSNFESCFYSNFKQTIFNYTNLNVVDHKHQEKSSEESYKYKTDGKEEEKTVFSVLLKFNKLAHQLKIETVIIDPHVLFCLLSKSLKKKLLKRKFMLEDHKASQYFLSLGIFQKYTDDFETEEALNIIKENGFKVKFIKSRKQRWMKCETCENNLITSHVILKYKHWTLHIAIFHQRNNFLWHSALMPQQNLYVPKNTTSYFLEHDGAFENFTAASLGRQSQIFKSFNVPSKPAEFLFEIESSKFLECNMSVVEVYNNLTNTEIPTNHSRFSVSEFNNIFVKSLKELKAQFQPLFLRFWIWSGTMLGWYRQCDIIPYTGDVDFGAWSSDVEAVDDLVDIFQKNKLLVIKQRMGFVDEGLEFNLNCQRLRVDIFFIQPESNGTWYAGHRPSRGYYFKYHHPNFSLCSAELLEHKVLVPCETEEVIVTEYGTDWIRPVTSWNYESSIKNRGPNIYWNKTLLEKVYADF